MIFVNGQKWLAARPVTVDMVLADLCFKGKRIAVEKNGEVVPKSLHKSTFLVPGDRIEIVVAVGGG